MTQVRPFKLNCYNQYQRSKTTKTSVPLASMSEKTQSIKIQWIGCISIFLQVQLSKALFLGVGGIHILCFSLNRVF